MVENEGVYGPAHLPNEVKLPTEVLLGWTATTVAILIPLTVAR